MLCCRSLIVGWDGLISLNGVVWLCSGVVFRLLAGLDALCVGLIVRWDGLRSLTGVVWLCSGVVFRLLVGLDGLCRGLIVRFSLTGWGSLAQENSTKIWAHL